MKIIGLALFWLLALFIIAMTSWAVTLYQGWPSWMAFSLFCGVLALFFLLKYGWRRIVLLRSRTRLAKQALPFHEQGSSSASPEARLRKKWNAAVATLRRSALRSKGDPLYVLPWFMVIGRSGAGKTTGLTRAGLSSPVQEVIQDADVEQTLNCDWWYLDRAVVIDCAGRYVDTEGVDGDRREWEVGLDLLGRYRPREGINGLVVAISADRLAAPDVDAFASEGRVLRARIDQLMTMFGKRFPIYVLITKCDLVYGFEEWARALPKESLSQAMGYLAIEPDENQFVDRALDSIGARLRALRLRIVADATQVTPELLMFPNELHQLKSGISAFVSAALLDTPYLERPLLRGLFFSSGQQAGGAVSSLLGGILPPSPRHSGGVSGFFLHDLFAQILPSDRKIARPALLRNHWRGVTRHVGIVAWILILSAFGGAMTVSFVGDMRTILLVKQSYTDSAVLNGDVAHDAATLAFTNDVLLQIEKYNHGWLSRLIGSGTGLPELEAHLRRSFTQQYGRTVLPAIDQNWRSDVALVSAREADSLPESARQRAVFALSLSRSINLMQGRLSGKGRAELQALPQTVSSPLLTPKLQQTLNGLQISYLVWTSPDSRTLGGRLNAERALLEQLLDDDAQERWLVGLVSDDGTLSPVRASDFWGTPAGPYTSLGITDTSSISGIASPSDGVSASSGEVIVPAVYTAAGRKALHGLLGEIRAAVGDPTRFDSQREKFERWYDIQRVGVWERFADAFGNDSIPYVTEAEWRSGLASVASPQSPYFRVVARIADEFDEQHNPSAGASTVPSWLTLSQTFEDLSNHASQVGAMSPIAKVAGAINAGGASALRQALSGSPVLGAHGIRDKIRSVEALDAYWAQLNRLAVASASGSGKDYEVSASFHQFASNQKAQPSEMMNALQSLSDLENIVGTGDASEQVVWKLIRGPFEFLAAYVEQQTSCELQSHWQSDVLWPLQGAPDKTTMVEQLFGTKGTVWAFVDGPAKPFLSRNSTRYDVIDSRGYRLPFTPAFLPMLNGALQRQLAQQQEQQRVAADRQTESLRARNAQLVSKQTIAHLDSALAAAQVQDNEARATSLPVTITAQSTGVNPDAKVKPYATALTVQCAAGITKLNNYNFPVSETFTWKAGQCGDTSLQIKIGDLTLTRSYPGPFGVTAFLRDFSDGTRTFTPQDFPGSENALVGLGVRQLTVAYSFSGSAAVLLATQKINDFENLQKSTAQEKQRILDAQLDSEQINIVDQIAAQAPPLPAFAPVLTGSAPSLMELGVPARVGACWRPLSASK